MKKFAFSLERVLQVKRQRERQAELRQQQARGELARLEQEICRLEERIRQSAELLQSAAARASDPLPWIARYEQSRQLAEILDAARQSERRALAKLEEANRLRKKASIEVEALLLLRRQELQAYQKEAQHEQQNWLDEQGLRKWRGERT